MFLRVSALRLACMLMFAVCTAFVAGCGSKPVVSGTVTFNSQTLTAGEVSLVSSSGASRSGQISSDGKFEIVDPPTGDVTVVVTSTRVLPAAGQKGSPLAGNMKEAKAGVVQSVIPTKYNDVQTSPLRYTVVTGRQTLNLNLEG